MAGQGSRFNNLNYKDPKPLIQINGLMMFEHAISNFPKSDKNYLVINENISDNKKFNDYVKKNNINYEVVKTPNFGQAHSLYLFLENTTINEPFFVGPCDTVLKLNEFLPGDIDFCAITSTPSKFQSKNTEKFGFYDKDNDFFISKKNIDIKNHEVILGAFYFKNKDIFFNAYNEMILQNELINGEYYLDTIGNYINNSKNFYIKDFFSIGTPEELKDNIKKI
tara:strand:+ start:7076 stop:7744 length:669 start_codon:yes stop_codon:yes gene_type:complete